MLHLFGFTALCFTQTRLLGNRSYAEVRARETQTDVTPAANYANLACLAISYRSKYKKVETFPVCLAKK
ncbi:hypothetical protein ATANTOWER_029164 [Ataeniobius toweri]|uniref:Secreted protein n=1 Tax=Ataeniobius toweri TaxID=208326 RepID=A0ABU7C432_9TELE|nr:hypothetical protein [Ataeniobius toweri]